VNECGVSMLCVCVFVRVHVLSRVVRIVTGFSSIDKIKMNIIISY
jgi:hypothetical protein